MEATTILSRKLLALFPGEGVRNNAQSILDSYGVEDYEQEPARVRLAILKLSGSDIEELRKMTKCAKEDFRDILSWAEYPRQSKRWSMPDGPRKEKLLKEDRAEYEQWLST
jgi:hypothetical protein